MASPSISCRAAAHRGTCYATLAFVLLVLLLAQTVTVTAQEYPRDDPSLFQPNYSNFGPTFYSDRCPRPIGPDGNDRGCRCIRVRDYDDLRGAVRRMDDNECKCFEPFAVVKGPNEPPIEMDDMRDVTVMCQQFGSCQIQGPGTHFVVGGDESAVTLAGFRLMGASEGAIVVREDAGIDRRRTTGEQVFCDMELVGNQNGYQGGGAIFVGPRSRTYVKNSLFMQNAAQRMGGAIYSESSYLALVESSFVANYASIGGAVSSNMPDSELILADNEFDRNVAGLGPTYGAAIAANGHVQDYGGNEADPSDFMCLNCELSAGARPDRPIVPGLPVYNPNAPFQPAKEYVNINRAKAGDVVDNGMRTSTDQDVDVDFQVNRYRRYDGYEDDYDMYPDDVLFGPFHIKLYFGKGYQWQEQYDDLNMCLESKYREEKAEGREEPLQLYKCDEDEERQRFVAVGSTIRLDERRTLCLTYIDVRKIELHKCTNSIYQQWERLQADGKFRLSPVTDHRRCMTNHHHPRNEERIYLEWCEIAEDGDTLYWEVKWRDGVAPDRVTRAPTGTPTRAPTTPDPTRSPTASPTDYPTDAPTLEPTFEPTITKMPTRTPTTSPTDIPTTSPTKNPTADPTASPTEGPTTSPTKNPTFGPTVSKLPTRNPTKSPTANPTDYPTDEPTFEPTFDPTTDPTDKPTESPTASPTESPVTPWDRNAVPDPQCGTQAGGALCSQTLFCCSVSGFCGLGTKYCGEGCQSGRFCSNPVPAPAPVAEEVEVDKADPVVEIEIEDTFVVDVEPAKPAHSFSFLGSGGVDSINESPPSSESVDCGDQVVFIKNGFLKERACVSITSINAGNVCHRQLVDGSGRVWDVCCNQCEEQKNAARL